MRNPHAAGAAIGNAIEGGAATHKERSARQGRPSASELGNRYYNRTKGTTSDCISSSGFAESDAMAAGRAIGAALESGAGARELSDVLRHRLTEADNLTICAASAWAMRPSTALRMAEAVREDAISSMIVLADRIGATPALEAERQRQAWERHCADPSRRMRRART